MTKHVVKIQDLTLKDHTKELLHDLGCYMHSMAPMYARTVDMPGVPGLAKAEWDRVCKSPTTTGFRLPGYKEPQPHVPERVIYNGTTTIAVFPGGKKVKARPDKEAKFDKETGLAMCIAKHVFKSRAAFLKAVEGANDQNKVESVE